MAAYIKTDDTLTVFIDGKLYTVFSGDAEWSDAVHYAKHGAWMSFKVLADKAEQVRKYAQGKLEVRDGAVYYQGRILDNALTKRILRMQAEGFPIDPLVKFAGNLYQNPSHASVTQLYTFLEANDQPITEDGCFMAYKRVRDDYRDVFSGKFLNTVGAVIKMPRNEVVDDPEQTCSSGLHVASLPYLAHYSGERLLAVKVNPRDVVSVPTDYQNSKMRVCEYEVVAELPMSLISENREAWDKSVVEYFNIELIDTAGDKWWWDGDTWTSWLPDAERYTKYLADEVLDEMENPAAYKVHVES